MPSDASSGLLGGESSLRRLPPRLELARLTLPILTLSSEELGRKPILQASLFLVNVWQVLCALSPNYGSLIVGRFLGGLSSAGGSVTLGMIADMWCVSSLRALLGFCSAC